MNYQQNVRKNEEQRLADLKNNGKNQNQFYNN